MKVSGVKTTILKKTRAAMRKLVYCIDRQACRATIPRLSLFLRLFAKRRNGSILQSHYPAKTGSPVIGVPRYEFAMAVLKSSNCTVIIVVPPDTVTLFLASRKTRSFGVIPIVRISAVKLLFLESPMAITVGHAMPRSTSFRAQRSALARSKLCSGPAMWY
jgi:hypothetical protein